MAPPGYENQEDLELTVPIEDPSRRFALYGTADRNLRMIRAAFEVRITAREDGVHIRGPAEAVARAARVLEHVQRCLRTEPFLDDARIRDAIDEARVYSPEPAEEGIDLLFGGTRVVPKGEGQRRYIETIQHYDITFCAGPAGTGKTYLAVAVALALLKQGKIKRLVLARPAVEAGEKLGYLPGDMQAKVNPYLRPLFDAMHDMLSFEQIKRFMQNDIIEVIPLAFMRGRTLNHALIILDEAQNATIPQMMMFLTRLGHDSKMIITGDDSQSDLNKAERSGLVDAFERLSGVEGIAFVRLDRADIVRHRLVQDVVERYGTNGSAR